MAKDVFGPNSMGGSVNTNSLGFAYIDLGVNINPMKVGITAALGALQAYMIKAQTEMDTAMRNIWTLVDTSYNQIMKYQDQIYQLSREIPRSAQDLANGMYWIISATIPAADALTVLEAAAKSAVAGLSTTYKAADVLTDIINAYGYAASDAEHISDILFRTVERGKLTYDGLAGSLGKVVATAAAGNVPFEELAAAMATMTQIGLSADEASTALNRFILSIISPTNNATKAAKELGIEWDATALSSKGLIGMIQALDEATGGNIETMTNVVPEIRSLRAVLALARDSAEDFAGEVERMNNANGAMQRAFEKQADSIKNTMQNLQNAFFEFSSKMGQVMTPAIKAVANGLSSVFEWMANLPSATKEVLAYTILASTAFSTLSGTIMKLISSIGKLSLATMGPAGWIAAIGLVFALIVDIIAKTKDLNEETSRAAEKQGLLVEKLKDSAQSAGSAAKELESLISDYEKLSSKSEKTKEEQEKLNTVVAKIADIAPNVVSSWNDMGVAIGINIDAAKVKLKELYSVQRSYAQMTLNAAQAQQAAMASAITKIDASLPKLNAEFEKIQSLYQLGNIPGLYDKKTQDRILALGVRANEGLVKSMDDAIAYVAGSDKAFSDAIYAALKDAPKFIANWTKLSFDEQLDAILVLAEAKAKEGQSKLEQIADFSASKAEYAKLSFQAANAAATVQGLDETLSKLGDTANTNTNVAISETIDKLDELKTKIEAINTFGTYPERPLMSLFNAKSQIKALYESYPSNANDPTGQYHEQRKLLLDEMASLDKEIEGLLKKIVGNEIISADELAQLKADAAKAQADAQKAVNDAQEYWVKTMGDGLLPEYGDKLIDAKEAAEIAAKQYDKWLNAIKLIPEMAEIVSAEDFKLYKQAADEAKAKAQKSIEDAREYWVKTMGDYLIPEYGDALITASQAQATAKEEYKKWLDRISAIPELPEYGDALMTPEDAEKIMEPIREANRLMSDMAEIIGADILAFNKKVADEAKQAVKNAQEYWVKTMGDNIMPEYGDNLITQKQASKIAKEEYDKWLDFISSLPKLPEYGDALMTPEDAAKIMEPIYEANRALSEMSEIVSATDLETYVKAHKEVLKLREEIGKLFADKNLSGLIDIWQGISDTLGMASRGEYKGITGSLQALNDIFNPMIEFGKNYWRAIQEQMATGLDFAGAMDFLNNGLIKKLKESGEGVGKVLLQIGDYLKDTGIKAVDNIGSAISSLGSNLSTSIGGFFVEFGKYVINMIIDKFTRGLSMLDRKAEWSGEATDDKGRYQWLRLNRDGTPNPEGPDRSVRYWNEEKRRWEAWQVEKDYYKKLAEEEAKRRPAFQISEISGPMRDTIVTALSPLNQLNSMPSYVDRIVYAIREVRDIMSSAQTSSSLATASIQQTFNIQQVNILAPESSTFSSILADLDKQSRLAVAATGG